MPTPILSYIDGLQSIVDLAVYCFNNGATYSCLNGDPSEGAVKTETRNSNGQLIGSVTFNDARTGTLNCQYTLETDEVPGAANLLRATYIVSFRGRFYVCGAVKTSVVKGEVIKFSCEVTELQNPFMAALLSEEGQLLRDDVAANVLSTIPIIAANVRVGSVVTYSVQNYAVSGAPAPAGISINATTGLLSVNVPAGSYDVRVLAQDDIGDDIPLIGQGRYIAVAA